MTTLWDTIKIQTGSFILFYPSSLLKTILTAKFVAFLLIFYLYIFAITMIASSLLDTISLLNIGRCIWVCMGVGVCVCVRENLKPMSVFTIKINCDIIYIDRV